MSNEEFTITEQDGQFIYRQGDLSIKLYDDGLAIHGARDPFANEKWSVLFGPDVASGIIRLLRNPDVLKRFAAPES